METSQLLSEIQEEIGSDELLKTATRSQKPVSYNFIDLPLTRLHYVKFGEGPPLIMVPATISEINNWLALVQFFGQRYTCYFFELPGHGQSSPFKQPFHTGLVAQTVKDLIDALGIETISLMGFSFGGVLAMKTLYHMQERISQVILVSPAVTHRAIEFSRVQMLGMRGLVHLLRLPWVCNFFVRVVKSRLFGTLAAKAIRLAASVEPSIPLEQRLRQISHATFEVLTNQLRETLYLEQPRPGMKFSQPCYFAHSIYDPLLNFNTTVEVMQEQFSNIKMEKLYFPYHQPEVLPTLNELNRDYANFLAMLD